MPVIDRVYIQKQTRRLIKNLSRRIARVEMLGVQASQYAVEEYRELESRIPNRLDKLDDKQLRELYRDLKYINSLRTSTTKGAIKSKEKYEPLAEIVEALSKDLKNDFWSVYSKAYEQFPGLKQYKYEILEVASEYIYQGQTADSAVRDIIKQYQNTVEELGGKGKDNDVKLLFTSKLKKLL